MSVIEVEELTLGPTGNIRVGEGRRYRRLYQVRFDEWANNMPREAMIHEDIPGPGASYPGDASATLRDLAAAQTDDALKYIVTLDYATPDAEDRAENPLNDRVRKRWSFRRETRPAARDTDGNAILNSAKDPFDPPREMTVYYLELTVVRNEATYSPGTANAVINHVNDDTVTICGLTVGARKALLVEWGGVYTSRNGTNYWEVTYKLTFDPDTFDAVTLDQGLDQVVGGKKLRCVDSTGAESEIPQRLNGAGAQLPFASASVFLTDEIYETANLAALGLDI